MGLTVENSQPMFVMKEVEGKGRSVFLKAAVILKDSFVLEYEGDIISEEEADLREKVYEFNNEGCFIFFFKFKGTKMAIDATRRYGSLARLLNHSTSPNIRFHAPLVTDIRTGIPRIAAYALKDIHKGEEIVMDYGVRDPHISWLKSSQISFATNIDFDEPESNSSNFNEVHQASSLPTRPLCHGCVASCSLKGVKNLEWVSSVNSNVHICKRTKNSRRAIGEHGYKFTKHIIPKNYIVDYQSIGVPEKILKWPKESTQMQKPQTKVGVLESVQMKKNSKATAVRKESKHISLHSKILSRQRKDKLHPNSREAQRTFTITESSDKGKINSTQTAEKHREHLPLLSIESTMDTSVKIKSSDKFCCEKNITCSSSKKQFNNVPKESPSGCFTCKSGRAVKQSQQKQFSGATFTSLKPVVRLVDAKNILALKADFDGAATKFLSDITKLCKINLSIFYDACSASDNMPDKEINLMEKQMDCSDENHLKENYNKSDLPTIENKLVLVEKSILSPKSGMLGRNLAAHVTLQSLSASPSPQEAVVKPVSLLEVESVDLVDPARNGKTQSEKAIKEREPCLVKLSRIESIIRGLLAENNQSLLTVKETDGRRSIFLKAPSIQKDCFVLEFEGEIISEEEAELREQLYAFNNEGCAILSFKFNGKKMAIDATRRFDSVACLLNHSSNPNVRFHEPLVTDFKTGVPRIAAYALRDIHEGEEICMEYGVQFSQMRPSQISFATNIDFSETESNSSRYFNETYQASSLPIRPLCPECVASCSLKGFTNPEWLSINSGVHVCKRTKNRRVIGEHGYRFTKHVIPKNYIVGYQSIGFPEEILKRNQDLIEMNLQTSTIDSNIGPNAVKKHSKITSHTMKEGKCESLCSEITDRNCFEFLDREKSNSTATVQRCRKPLPSLNTDSSVDVGVKIKSSSDCIYCERNMACCSSSRMQLNNVAQEGSSGSPFTGKTGRAVQSQQKIFSGAALTSLSPTVRLVDAKGTLASRTHSDGAQTTILSDITKSCKINLSNLHDACFALDNNPDKEINLMEEQMDCSDENHLKENCNKNDLSTIESKLVLVEKSSLSPQSGMLGRNLATHVTLQSLSASPSPQVAVVKPVSLLEVESVDLVDPTRDSRQEISSATVSETDEEHVRTLQAHVTN